MDSPMRAAPVVGSSSAGGAPVAKQASLKRGRASLYGIARFRAHVLGSTEGHGPLPVLFGMAERHPVLTRGYLTPAEHRAAQALQRQQRLDPSFPFEATATSADGNRPPPVLDPEEAFTHVREKVLTDHEVLAKTQALATLYYEFNHKLLAPLAMRDSMQLLNRVGRAREGVLLDLNTLKREAAYPSTTAAAAQQPMEPASAAAAPAARANSFAVGEDAEELSTPLDPDTLFRETHQPPDDDDNNEEENNNVDDELLHNAANDFGQGTMTLGVGLELLPPPPPPEQEEDVDAFAPGPEGELYIEM